jgi:hypothetical protein
MVAPAVAAKVATYTPQGSTPRPAVFVGLRPQGSPLPAITLQTVTGDYPKTYDGLQATRDPRVQLNAWGETYEAARAIIPVAVAVLAPKEISNGIVFDNILFKGERDFIERVGTADIYRTSIDLIVWHYPA